MSFEASRTKALAASANTTRVSYNNVVFGTSGVFSITINGSQNVTISNGVATGIISGDIAYLTYGGDIYARSDTSPSNALRAHDIFYFCIHTPDIYIEDEPGNGTAIFRYTKL